MRTKLLTILAVMAMALTACNSKEKPKGQLNQGAMLYINVRANTIPRALPVIEGDEQETLTPHEIVKQAQNFVLDDPEGYKNALLGIGDEQRDLNNDRIKMWGSQIIDRNGELVTYFLESKDIRLIAFKGGKIIGYIPNKVAKKALEDIKKEYAAGNYDKVYKLFQDAYTAIPCTQKQWEALKEKGEQ